QFLAAVDQVDPRPRDERIEFVLPLQIAQVDGLVATPEAALKGRHASLHAGLVIDDPAFTTAEARAAIEFPGAPRGSRADHLLHEGEEAPDCRPLDRGLEGGRIQWLASTLFCPQREPEERQRIQPA